MNVEWRHVVRAIRETLRGRRFTKYRGVEGRIYLSYLRNSKDTRMSQGASGRSQNY